MEESSRMDFIPHIEEIPKIFYVETTTNSPPSSSWFLASMETWERILREKGFGI